MNLQWQKPMKMLKESQESTNNTFKKHQPTKALQWHATSRKKNDGKPNRGHNLDTAF